MREGGRAKKDGKCAAIAAQPANVMKAFENASLLKNARRLINENADMALMRRKFKKTIKLLLWKIRK